MACFDHGSIVELNPRETVSLPDFRGATLRVARGTVWITQEDDTQDVVLRTGDSWTVEHNGLTILEAQDDVSLCVIGRSVADALDGRRARRTPTTLWDRARDAVAGFLARSERGPVPYY
jgi:hypothetical protein